MGKREEMEAAIRRAKGLPTPPRQYPLGNKPPKRERSAAARDARARARGRLPDGVEVGGRYNAATDRWTGWVNVFLAPGIVSKTIMHECQYQFELFETLDILFWEWAATVAKEGGDK